MAAILTATLVLVAAPLVVGHAVHRLCGDPVAAAAPATGLALLLCVAAAAVELPGRAVTAAIVVAAAVVAAIVVARPARPPAAALVAALVTGGAALLPFLVSGRAGILGVGDDNDMSVHLKGAYWLQTHDPPPPRLIGAGYPIGPHALVAAVGRALHLSLPATFDGLELAIPILTALVAYRLLRGRRPVRAGLAVLVGLPYLSASWLAMGAFKEPLEGLLCVGVVAALASMRAADARAGVPLGLLLAGTVVTYSHFGLLWPAATIVVLACLAVVVQRAAALRHARAYAASSAVAVATLAVAIAPQAARISAFTRSTFANEPRNGTGNLVAPISPLQALGIWPASDFRFDPSWRTPTVVLAVVATVALVGAVVGLVRARTLAVPAGVVGAAVVYWQAESLRSPYNAAKALAVAAPLVALALAAAATRLPRSWIALALLVAIPAAASSFLALRDAPVGPAAHERALAELRGVVHGQRTLFLGHDDLVQWELRGVHLATLDWLYSTWIVPSRHAKPRVRGTAYDFDSVDSTTLDSVRYVVAPRTPYASTPPSNFHVVRRSRWYDVWERSGRTARRAILDEAGAAGAKLDCTAAPGRRLSRRRGVAGVQPTPVVVPPEAWSAHPRDAGGSATLSLALTAGSWDLGLQYVAREGITVTAPGLRAHLPGNLERMGPYWPAGTIRVARRGTVRVTVEIDALPWFGRLLGARGTTRPLSAAYPAPIGALVAVRHGARERVVPLRRACGRYVDWYRIAGATSGGSHS